MYMLFMYMYMYIRYIVCTCCLHTGHVLYVIMCTATVHTCIHVYVMYCLSVDQMILMLLPLSLSPSLSLPPSLPPLLPPSSQSYYDEMDPESLSIPLRLRGKRDIVFGNLLDIKNFHEE